MTKSRSDGEKMLRVDPLELPAFYRFREDAMTAAGLMVKKIDWRRSPSVAVGIDANPYQVLWMGLGASSGYFRLAYLGRGKWRPEKWWNNHAGIIYPVQRSHAAARAYCEAEHRKDVISLLRFIVKDKVR